MQAFSLILPLRDAAALGQPAGAVFRVAGVREGALDRGALQSGLQISGNLNLLAPPTATPPPPPVASLMQSWPLQGMCWGPVWPASLTDQASHLLLCTLGHRALFGIPRSRQVLSRASSPPLPG